jgi:hypothetical protein
MNPRSLILFPLKALDPITKGLEIDCAISEDYKSSSIVTGYPVSLGFRVSDHTIQQNAVLVLEIQIGNHMSKLVSRTQVQDGDDNVVIEDGLIRTYPAGSFGVEGSIDMLATGVSPQSRVGQFNNYMDSLERNGIPCKVVTLLKTYDNCVLVDYQHKEDLQTSSVLRATLRFEIVRPKGTLGASNAKGTITIEDPATAEDAYGAVTATSPPPPPPIDGGS